MIIYKEIFNITDILYKILQLKNLDIVYCNAQVNSAIERIKLLRTDEKTIFLFNEAKKISPLEQKRRLTEESDQLNKYKILQFEILDNIITQMTERFRDLNKLKFVLLVDFSKF